METNEIKSEIKKFIIASTEDDHEATNKHLSSIINTKITNRYNDSMSKLKSED